MKRMARPLVGVLGPILVLVSAAGALLGASGVATAGPADALVTGEMTNFTLLPEPRPVSQAPFRDAAGRRLSLADFRGKVVLVNLWATWCAPCRREMPSLDRLQARLGGPDFEVVAISQDRGGMPKVIEFLTELGIRNLVPYNDKSTKSSRAFAALGLPTTLLVDRAGNEVGRLVGPAEWDGPAAEALIRHFIDIDAPHGASSSRRPAAG